MGNGPLSAAQLDDFMERGWTVLRQAFPADMPHAVRRELGRRIGVDLERPEEWTNPRVWLQEVPMIPPFTDALTDRFCSAVDQLVGAGRWQLRRHMGWWPVTFPGFDVPPYGADWHVEGNFAHHPWSPEQALLNLFCFSTVASGDGGTRVVEGSHHEVARLIWDSEPKSLEVDAIWPKMSKLLDERGWSGVVEVTAEEGDVVLAHPLLFHSSTPNRGTHPRVMAQPGFDMTEPKRTQGDGLFPVEIPIARARPRG
jgi:hypothetical protein